LERWHDLTTKGLPQGWRAVI